MLFLQLVLLVVLLPDGDSEDGENSDPTQWVHVCVRVNVCRCACVTVCVGFNICMIMHVCIHVFL